MAVLSNSRIYCRNHNVNNGLNILKRFSSFKGPEPIFLENAPEEPIIVMREGDDVDIIGPPDPVSNLRPIIRKRLANETTLQTRLRNMQDVTQEWNHKFWTEHNKKFAKEKQSYIASYLKGQEKRQLTADEMSEFYKKFLDENWTIHVKYNGDWYRRNFTLLFLSLLVSLEKSIRTVMKLS